MNVAQVALSAAAGTARSKLKEVKANATLTLAATVSATVAAIFLLIAATIAIASEVGAIWSCIIMAAIFLALTGILLLRRKIVLNRKSKAAKAEAIPLSDALTSGKQSSLTLPLMALAAGYALSRKD